MSVNKITNPITPNDLIDKINEVIDNLDGSGGGSKTTWYGTSSTPASAAAKEVTCSGFTLEAGAIIAVMFTTANTASTPTLNVNSTGAKSIYVGAGTVNGTTNVLKWSANTVLVFMYDGTYFRYIASRAAASVAPPDGAGSWYGTSSTGASTAAKTSTIANFRLMRGAVVSITFTNANTASGAITLNINSTGAKTVYYNNAATSSSNRLLWNANETLTFIYTGSYYYFIACSKPRTNEIIGVGEKDVSVLVSDSGINASYIDEETGNVTTVIIDGVGIMAAIDDGNGKTIVYDMPIETTWTTPTITDSYVTIDSGGYYVDGRRCYVQMRVQLTSDLAANSGRNVMSGLPIPAEVSAAALSILANNRGGHGVRVTNGGAIQIIADTDHGITAGQNIDITGVYTIQ